MTARSDKWGTTLLYNKPLELSCVEKIGIDWSHGQFFRCANRQRKRKRKGQGQRQVLSGFRRQGCVVGMGIQHRFHMISHDSTENHHNATNKHGNFTNNCALNHVGRPWINQSQPEICHIYRYLYYTYTCIHIHINMYIFICIHFHIIQYHYTHIYLYYIYTLHDNPMNGDFGSPDLFTINHP